MCCSAVVKLFSLVVCSIYFAACISAQTMIDRRFVEMKGLGRVRGDVWNISGQLVQEFKGIPYAEPPVGDLRIRKTVMKQKWSGTMLLSGYGAPCLQFMQYNELDRYAQENMKRQSEDCLTLNIFGPYTKDDDSRRYPVLVWVHGGSFLAGSGDVSMDTDVMFRNLVFRGVILVTLNYRLGPLGFTSHKADNGFYEGNYGLWDIVTALHWINNYIRYFGGDPDAVTLMGESAGGAAVSILAMSPVTENLVHQAIIMSGSATAGWAVHRGDGLPSWDVSNIVNHLTCVEKFDKEVKEDLRKELGIMAEGICALSPQEFSCPEDHTSPVQLMECLRKVNFTDATFKRILAVELSVSKAVVDGELIPALPEEMLKNYTRIPIMTGIAEHEWGHKGMSFYGFKSDIAVTREKAAEKVKSEFSERFRQTLTTPLPNSTLDLIGNASFHRYFASKTPNETMSVKDFVFQLQKLEADLEFVAPCQTEYTGYARSGLPVYVYSWEHLPEGMVLEQESKMYNLFGTRKEIKYNRSTKYEVAFHGVDHAYIFTEGYSSQMMFRFTDKDRMLSDLLCTMITNFVKYGNPTPEPVDDLTWPRYTPESPGHIRFRLPTEISHSDVGWDGANFWNRYVPFLSKFTDINDETAGRLKPLDDEDRMKMNAYQRAWYALWILVAAIGLLLWTIIICLVARKCINARSKPYNNIIVTNNRS